MNTNIYRFKSEFLAREFAAKMTSYTHVFLGDDGRYWVPANNRTAQYLEKSGYQIAKAR